ncbi:TlpA family protein disulfide reductase [Streptomyces werraensis]|uniref:TlpA family protein disulfide reductase n=1 Tax=Streptomyces werraensis TaxID=68284 RepID=UPI0038147DCE
MSIALAVLALLMASAACALSVAVALRVKKLLDPLTEEGVLSRPGDDLPSVGTVVPPTAGLVDMDGKEVRLPVPGSQPWILSFQSVGCSGCEQQLPGYKKFLRDTGVARDRVISIVVGDRDGVALYRDELGELARVIAGEEQASSLLREVGVSRFPTYLVVDGENKVMASSGSSARLADSGSELSASVAARS